MECHDRGAAYLVWSRCETALDHLGLCDNVAVRNLSRLGQAGGTTGGAVRRDSGRVPVVLRVGTEPIAFAMIQKSDEGAPTGWNRLITSGQDENLIVGNRTC